METLFATAPADVVPEVMNFGGVPFDAMGPDITPVSELPSFNGGYEIKDAPSDAMLSVSISGDTNHFFIRDVYVMEWVMETVDPGELPPGHHGPLPKVKVLSVVSSSDGKSPVIVKQHQYVLIRVSYAAGFVEGSFNGILNVVGDTWDKILVPLSLFIADVKTIPTRILNIAQGNKASLPFTITSIAGPQVNVHFEMSPTQLHTGLTLTQNNFTLLPKQSQTVLLEFTADKDAAIGYEEVALDQYAFRRIGFFFTANIVHTDVTINPLIPNRIFVPRRSSLSQIPISVQLNNGPAIDISFSAFNLPSDVSIQDGVFSGSVDGIVTMNMHTGNAVPDEFNFFINWETQWGQKGSISFFVVIVEPETITLNTYLVTADGIAINGSVQMILKSNGDYTFSGDVRATGFPSYNYGLQAFIKAADGILLTAFHSGSVYGTDSPFNSKRQDDWSETLNSQLIKENWSSIRTNPQIEYQFNANIGGVLGTLWDVLKAGLEVIGAFIVAGPTGAAIVLGNELLSAAHITPPPGMDVSIAILEGSVLVFGPGIIVPAFVAGAAAGVAIESLIKMNALDDREKNFARIIFDNTLDEKFSQDKVWKTNLAKSDGSKFTIPSLIGDKILVNMGNAAYDDPVQYAGDPSGDYSQKGAVFAHELTHACQIAVNKFIPGLICNGSGTYTYHQPDGEANRLNNPQWSLLSWENDFTREQQAHIVDDWYGAFCGDFADLVTLSNNLSTTSAINDPAFHFIIKCRGGIF